MNGYRTATAASLLILALTTAGCSGTADQPSSTRSGAPGSPSPTPSATPTPSSTPSSSSGVSAARPGHLVVVPADRAGRCTVRRPVGVVCRARLAYRFQPEAVRTVLIARADAAQGANGQWVVDLNTTAAGRRTLAGVTRSAARTREFVLLMPTRNGPVITAAQVQEAITGGQVQVATASGALAAAQKIVNQITRTAR